MRTVRSYSALYLNLDPSEFAVAPARESAGRSLVDQARKRIEAPDVEHEDQRVLRASLERAERFLQDDLPTEGVHAPSLFAAEPLDLFETVTLPCTLPKRVAIAHSPLVAPLAMGTVAERWCVVLVNREQGRVQLGDRRRLAQVADVEDDTHGQHDQGGWSQARFQRSVGEALDRLGGPQSAVGVQDVLAALNERRVENLLLAEGWTEPGVVCPACGWVGRAGTATCPADGTQTDRVDDLSEPVVHLALQQDARVLVVRRCAVQLRALGELGALLRF